MKLTFIDCSCGNTKGFQLADKLAECTSCALPVHIDTPSYHTYELDSLNKIEQQAREQAVIDMWIADEIDWGNKPFINWSTCFDVNNITNNDICDCTAPQVDEDKMCICGLPISIEDNWTNDSGYSDVFH